MTYDLPDTILRVDRLPVMTLLLESSYFPGEYTELVILSGEPPLILGFFSPVDITIGTWFAAFDRILGHCSCCQYYHWTSWG